MTDVRWVRLSGSALWHLPSKSAFDAVLCGNPSTGVVLRKTSVENDPPGPTCQDCLARALEKKPS